MLIKRKSSKHHINPRFRAYGKARLDIARRAESRRDWDTLWKQSTFPFPFEWGEHWRQCIEYKVDDFAAEVGFFIDILGLPVNAFDPDYAMFTSPNRDFFFAVVPTQEGSRSTPPEAIRLQFMITNLLETAEELQRRGIQFERFPGPCRLGASLYIGEFHTPHGICVELWGMVEATEVDEEDFGYSEDFEQVELESNYSEDDVESLQVEEAVEAEEPDEELEPEGTEESSREDQRIEGLAEAANELNFSLFSRRTQVEAPIDEFETDEIGELLEEDDPVEKKSEEDPYSFLLADKGDDEENEWDEEDDSEDVEYVDDDY